MNQTLMKPDLDAIPARFHSLLEGAEVFDSSCSKEARVIYIQKDGGLFLKSAPRGTLKAESTMSAYFHSHQLGPEVLAYFTDEKDWLLTRCIPGEDCTTQAYLDDPKRLADTLGTALRYLHSLDCSQCPVKDRVGAYISTARSNHAAGKFDLSLFPGHWGFPSAEDAWRVIRENAHHLKNDTLIHGDYCLPNVMLDNWHFSGFIDVGSGGVGDRHMDLFWGMWTLFFNLKTEEFGPRFLDAYGREAFEPEMLRLVAALEVFQ